MMKFTQLLGAVCATALAVGTANAADPITRYAVTSAGSAVTELQDGHNYLIRDAHADDGTTTEQAGSNSCRYAFRYDAGTTISGTHVKPANVTNLTKAHVWAVTSNSDGTYSFKNLDTDAWVKTLTHNVAIAPTTDESEKGSFTLTAISGKDAQFYVTENGIGWDGNGGGTYQAVAWNNGNNTSHPIEFYEVTEDNSTNITFYPVSATFKKGETTVATASDVYLAEGSKVFTSETPVSAESTSYEFTLDDNVTAIKIKNIRQSKYVGVAGSYDAGYSFNQNASTGNSTIFLQVGGSDSYTLFNPSTLTWGNGAAVATDESAASTYTTEVDRTGTSTINQKAYYYTEAIIWAGSGNNGWNDSAGTGVCAWGKTDAGSRWYTMAYDDADETNLNNNTADACTALQEAVTEATDLYDGAATLSYINQEKLAALKTAIDAANAARIGFDDFAALTEALNSAADELLNSAPILSLAQALAAANAVLTAHPTAEHPTPGYFNATDEAYTTFTAAIKTATALVEANDATNVDAQVKAINDAVTAFIAATPSEPVFTALYRIANSEGRGALAYDSSLNGQVYYIADTAETDDNSLWAFAKDTTGDTDQVYLYNVGANQFIGLATEDTTTTGYHYGNYWAFGVGVDITLTPSSVFGYPTLEISTGETHMSVSTSYVEPIITYYDAEDGGVPFVFTYVKDIDTDVQTAIDTLIYGSSSISEISSEAAPAATTIYDLQGRRVARAAHGIYIINGKKVKM